MVQPTTTMKRIEPAMRRIPAVVVEIAHGRVPAGAYL